MGSRVLHRPAKVEPSQRDGSIDNVIAWQAQEPGFGSQHLCEKLDSTVSVCVSLALGMETSR